MKTKIFFVLCFAFSFLSAQDAPTLTELPRKVYREQKREIKDVERQIKRDRDVYDILPSPIEVPLVVPDEYAVSIQAIESWQTRTQRINEIQNRLRAEWKYPVHFRISDSGADETHPDLTKGFTGSNNWTTEDDRPGRHGTHVAGDVLQFVWPAIETGFVTWGDDKTLLASGSGSFAWPTQMLNAEIDDTKRRVRDGETVIFNFSWGAGISSPVQGLEDAMKRQVDAGAFLVAAAGNSGAAVGYPGFSDQTLCVTSLDESLTISSFSSRGPSVTSTAGGRNIYSTLPDGSYGFMSGTSMASPSFAAFLGVARGKWGPKLLPDYEAVRRYFKKIGTKTGTGNPEFYGDGYAFIERILDTKPDNQGEDPPSDPPTDPAPPQADVYFSATFDDGYVMRWRYIGDAQWNIIQVPTLTVEVLSDKLGDVAYDEVAAWLPAYFTNRGIELPSDMWGYDAVWWTGQFLEYIAEQDGLLLDVVELTGIDESTGGEFHAVDFDRANARSLSEFFAKIVDLD